MTFLALSKIMTARSMKFRKKFRETHGFWRPLDIPYCIVKNWKIEKCMWQVSLCHTHKHQVKFNYTRYNNKKAVQKGKNLPAQNETSNSYNT